VLLLGTTRSYISNRLPPPPPKKKNHSGSYITQHHHLHSDTMPLLTLPVEIIFMIARLLTDDQGEVCFADLNAFLQANSILNDCLDYSLWHEAVTSPSAAERVFTHLIRTDDLANLKFFLELGADIEMNLPNARSETSRRTTSHPMVCTVLHVAAQFDRVKIARFLLEHGVTVVHYDKRNRPSYNAIHDARSAEILQLLLDHNADFEQQVIKLQFDGDGYRPLHYYAMRGDVQAMRAVLHHGANVDPIERAFWRRRTPLDYAARSSADAVKVLLEHGADLQRRDHDSATPLHHAAGVAKTDVVQLMLEYWPEGQSDKDKYGHTPMHFSARAGNTKVVRLLLDYCPEGLLQKNRDGNTPLHLAAQAGHIDAMSLLAKRWSEGIPGPNNQGEKPLSMFLQHGLAEHEDVEEEGGDHGNVWEVADAEEQGQKEADKEMDQEKETQWEEE
jgi:ankyrin repeat protein